MVPTTQTLLINFLQEELLIPAASIHLAIEYSEQTPSLIPVILWQYGLITLPQLDRAFDWLEHNQKMAE